MCQVLRSCFFLFLLLPGVALGLCTQDSITIQIRTDDFGSEVSWQLYNQTTSALVSSRSVFSDNTLYTDIVCVAPGCYFLVINDTGGDGLCCIYGSGYYNVYYNQTLIGTGSAFAHSKTVFNIGDNCSIGTTSITADNTAYTPQQLVTNFLDGACISTSNVTYTGSSQAIGYFTNGAALGMSTGILLTTGSTDNAVGPNNTSDVTTVLNVPGDADLNTATGLTTLDATSLQFDFIPYSDSVAFNYVFASDEYPEFVCSPYMDVFAFLVSGPGYAANTNIALIPGTGTAVSINSINGGSPGLNQVAANCVSLANSAYYNSNLPPASTQFVTQYDGFTDVLTAKMAVQPCSTYQIKMVIGDVGDRLIDSGVFLAAGSFNANANGVTVSATGYNGTKNIVEGCADGHFNFTRDNPASNSSSIVINFTLTGSGAEGTDYQNITHSVTIPANQNTAQVAISAILDALPEGSETIILSYQSLCGCNFYESDTLYILDLCDDNNLCTEDSCSGSGCVFTPVPNCDSCDVLLSTVTLYSENFTGYSVGTTTGSGAPAKWTAGNPANDDYFSVQNVSGNLLFAGKDIKSEGVWTSQTIDISGYGDVTVSIDISEAGAQDATDYIRVTYSVDGGTETNFAVNGQVYDDFAATTANQTGLSGSTLVIRVRMSNNANDEIHYFDNVVVTGVDTIFNCDDANVCTDDECVTEICVFTAIICDDGNACTTDGCHPVSGCMTTPIICDDADLCTTDACAGGTCNYTPVLCDDADLCTTDACVAGACNYTPVVCDDADLCTTDTCVSGTCDYTPVVCDDADLCTTDACVAGTCDYTPIVCDDADLCTTDACVAGTCDYTPVLCDDADLCTTDACVNGSCNYTPVVCNDANLCTTDACVSGVCIYTGGCDDADPCTLDVCSNGVCKHSRGTLATDSLYLEQWRKNCCCK